MINVRMLCVISASIIASIITANGTLHEFNGRTFEQVESIIQEHPYVLIDFWAIWCGPCKHLKPELKKVAGVKTDLYILLINYDQYRAIADRYGVTSLPTLLLFKNGAFVRRIMGHQFAGKLLEIIKDSAT